MKRLILTSLIGLLCLSTQAKNHKPLKKQQHEIGINTYFEAKSGIPIEINYGINYHLLLGKRTAIQSEINMLHDIFLFDPYYPYTLKYKVNLGLIHYVNNQHKGFYTGANLVFRNIPNQTYYSRQVLYNQKIINIELGYSFLIKQKWVLQAYTQPFEYNNAYNNHLVITTGIRIKRRF